MFQVVERSSAARDDWEEAGVINWSLNGDLKHFRGSSWASGSEPMAAVSWDVAVDLAR